MSAIEHCRTSVLGGHILQCPECHAPMVIIELLVGINYPRAPPERIINPIERMALKKMTV